MKKFLMLSIVVVLVSFFMSSAVEARGYKRRNGSEVKKRENRQFSEGNQQVTREVRDHDGDGIPNGKDPDYVKGSGKYCSAK